ncbi:MAG: hypothetical protein V7K97_03725 [Nostoc sp.]|uniref:hypothetical protein n=1 Tax=Nostoc sp. TaxID=1180 RepID=UPI002FF75C2E
MAKILIVDDEKTLRQAIAQILRSEGYEVLEAAVVQQNQFREDLFYRLNVMRIDLPPLRDRPEDLEELTQHFLNTIAMRRGLKRLALAQSAMEKLKSYTFPGNVRELQNTLERAAILSGGRTIWHEYLIFSQQDET